MIKYLNTGKKKSENNYFFFILNIYTTIIIRCLIIYYSTINTSKKYVFYYSHNIRIVKYHVQDLKKNRYQKTNQLHQGYEANHYLNSKHQSSPL